MSEDNQQEDNHKRAGWRIALILVILLLLYVLSPPFVVQMVGVENYVNYGAWFYWPLVELSHSSERVRTWYGSYFELFSTDDWYAWYLGKELFSESGGFGEVMDVRPL